jgi:hypothetical protein
MNSLKRPKDANIVWRISEAAPLGEWVDRSASAPRSPAKDPSEITFGSWFSSFDLQEGASVSEDLDTVPGELFDELFTPKPPDVDK